jgi:hypothetical protein
MRQLWILLGWSLLTLDLQAQTTVYRCQNGTSISYSEVPCRQTGTTLNLAETVTEEEKDQAEQTTRQMQQQARQWEKERLDFERSPLQAAAHIEGRPSPQRAATQPQSKAPPKIKLARKKVASSSKCEPTNGPCKKKLSGFAS